MFTSLLRGVTAAIQSVAHAIKGAFRGLRRRSRSKARAPDVQMTISEGRYFEGRYVSFTFDNPSPSELKLVGIQRHRPRKMRLWPLLARGAPPEGDGASQISASKVLPPNKSKQAGLELFFKLPEAPAIDAGQKVSFRLLFVVRNTEENLYTIARGRIPSPHEA